MTAIPDQLAAALAGRYVVQRQLGRGGMATVYLAHDIRHDRPVALKVLHSYVASTLGPERFLQEIRLAARLQHPHILTVFDSGESSGQLWFTMPYVEGESLRDRLRRERTVPPAEALRIAREAGQALEYAHRHGVVHRDIKPENILLTQDGNTLIADFGIARTVGPTAASNLTAAGVVVGTPSYMSPEQAMGEPTIDGRSDVYSLGCVLYEMLSGQPPFTAPTAQGIVAKHLSQAVPVLADQGLAMPGIDQVIARAMAKSPDQRFSSAAEFVRALEPIAPQSRRSRAQTAALGLIALTLLILVWIGSRRLTQRTSASGSAALGGTRRLTQVTVGGDVEAWPAWSPDGTKLVYSGEADGYRQLYLRTLSTAEDQRLTRRLRDDIQAAWSPDGRRLAFVRASTERGKLEPSDINAWYTEGGDIWVLDLDTGTESRLVGDAFGPAWSPDGKRLAFDARWAGPRRIWVSDASGRNPRQITTDSNDAVVHADPRWSPDGSRLVFRVIENTKWDIAVVNLATSSIGRLTNDVVADLDPVWAPDGRRVYYSSGRGGGVNLWQMPMSGNAAAGPAEQLTTGPGDDVQPAPSPDGRRIAFTVLGINSDIWRLPVSPASGRVTGQAEPVLATSRVESRGAWSPDGGTIAFNSDRRGDMNIWIRSLTSGAERQLTQGAGGDYQPNWSPDAKTIVFFSSRAGNADIWSVRVSDGALTQLTGDPSTETNPFYSPDGRHIAYLSEHSGRSEVWVMNADGSNQRRVYDGQAGGHFLRWTADGSAVVFRAENGAQTQVVAQPLAGGPPVVFPPISSGAHLSFSPDRTLILDVRGHKSLWVHPVDGRPPYKIFEFPDGDVRIDYPVWSPDGKWVLFDRAAPRSGDVWMLSFGP